LNNFTYLFLNRLRKIERQKSLFTLKNEKADVLRLFIDRKIAVLIQHLGKYKKHNIM